MDARIVFLFCLLCIIIVQGQRAPPPPTPPPANYLSLQWPTSYCRVKHCKVPTPLDFTIHGLWFHGPAPKLRPCPKFVLSQLSSLTKDLDTFWPNLELGKSNALFWEHEWDTHGACFNLKQVDYFRDTLSTFKTTKVLQDLKGVGIVPGTHNKYAPSAFKNIPNDPLITCKPYGNQVQLAEVRYCVNNAGTKIVQCLPSQGGVHISCTQPGQDIEFPL